jgi:hypothetical protein
MKKLVLISILPIIFGYNLYSQALTEAQMQQFMPKLKNLLADYQTYGHFSQDGAKIDWTYVNSFQMLFSKDYRYSVYNDLTPDKDLLFYSPEGYAALVEKYFPTGLDVTIDIDNHQIIESSISRGKFLVTVKVSKRIAGIRSDQNIFRKSIDLYFFISALETPSGIDNLRISGISNESKYASITRGRTRGELFVGVIGVYSSTRLYNSNILASNIWLTENGSSINPSIFLTFMINKNIGISTGFRMSTYQTQFTIKSYNGMSNKLLIDIDEEDFYPIYNTPQLLEANTVKSYDVPLLLNLMFGGAKLKVYANLGVQFTMINDAYYTLSGQTTKSGFYPNYNVVLSDIPEYGFETYNFNPDQKNDMKITGNFISGYASTGIAIPLNNLLFNLGVNFTHGFTDIGFDKPRYESDFNYTINKPVKNTFLQSFGFELGLMYRVVKR